MNSQQKDFLRFIKLLSDNECLDHVVLIGSWTEFLYKETKLLGDFKPEIKTLDVDFLIKNLHKPIPEKNLAALARSENYLVMSDVLNGTTKIQSPEGLEIEFLINKVGAGYENSLRTNLGVTAQSLRHMNILLNNTMKLRYFEMDITVPRPEAYVLHKAVINEERGKKREKDAANILNIWSYIDKNVANEILAGFTKKEKNRVNSFFSRYNLELTNETEPEEEEEFEIE